MSRRGKVLPADLIAGLRTEWGRRGMTVGQCHGCFDILHEGHIHYLRQAAEQVDVLLVSVTAARHVGKGPGRPVFGDRARLSVLAALDAVDHVALSDFPTAVPLIELWRPDFYFKGADYADGEDPRVAAERDALEATGGKFFTTDGSIFDSSTRALRAWTAR
ncbi:adenylyltransferase/cytidyltransferase family protein [Streptomyces zhihengii]|uniref:adenylyltransferase/cytidyltransferase family protein n=1 Tax=Streptomyces zhihengii TaxID=1818004 RepID=UPI00362D4BD8